MTQILEKKSIETTQSMLSTEEHKLSVSSSEDYSLVFTSGSMFIFQDDDFKENDTLETSESAGAMDEYLKIPKKHPPIVDQEVASTTGKSAFFFSHRFPSQQPRQVP